jgi:hypothetical protein
MRGRALEKRVLKKAGWGLQTFATLACDGGLGVVLQWRIGAVIGTGG